MVDNIRNWLTHYFVFGFILIVYAIVSGLVLHVIFSFAGDIFGVAAINFIRSSVLSIWVWGSAAAALGFALNQSRID